ncbi:MAG: RNA polymerase sporulation sigma factor SigK [Clostridia bacterium]|nr:RNA polymerase sporulation sigma factor SigK [Clostridia bacterium]
MILKTFIDLFFSILQFALHVGNNLSFPPPLNKKEEDKLILENLKGNKNARDKLIKHNLRLVAHIVKKYYTVGYDQDDLISIGTIGLIKGVSSFNPDKKIKLTTYVSKCIENEILMYFRASKKSNHDVFINDTIDTDKDGNTLTLIDIIADSTDIENEIETKSKVEELKKVFGVVLDEREQKILNMRYGINGEDEYTQKEIAKMLGISRSYVSRIETAALKKLKKLL